MARRARLKSPFVITVLAASAVTSAVACGGSTSDNAGFGGAGNSSGSGGTSSGGTSSGGTSSGGTGGNSSSCPASFPTHDTPCSVPNGTTCNYDQGSCCPDWGASCVDGKWEAYASSCNPPAPDPCPTEIPVAGAACGSSEPCGNNYQYCTYGVCPDGSSATVAECNGSVWTITTQKECGPPPCEGLSACECFDRADCTPESNGCLCPCDFKCGGDDPGCACACGGGTYLGCVPAPRPQDG